MTLVRTLARLLPARVRQYGRALLDREFGQRLPALADQRASALTVSLDLVLAHYRLTHPHVRYLQIGAFDGVTGDPMRPLIERHGLTGILVEPQRDAFQRLRANYAAIPGSTFTFVNAAIADHDGEATLYRIAASATGPEWLPQLASFDRSVLMGHAHLVPGIESLIETETVRCITVATLFREAAIESVDLLQIDAEGYDAELLRLFDVPSRRPAIVRFEHKHLTADAHNDAVAMLVREGYRVAVGDGDTLAYRSDDAVPARDAVGRT